MNRPAFYFADFAVIGGIRRPVVMSKAGGIESIALDFIDNVDTAAVIARRMNLDHWSVRP